MGVILDSSVLIAGERRSENVRQILKRVHTACGDTVSALSVITIVELTHGIYRAQNDTDRQRRRAFVEELRRDMVVHPISVRSRSLLAASRRAGSPWRQNRFRRLADRCHGLAHRL